MWVLFLIFGRLRRNPPCGYAASPLCKGGKDDVTRSASLVKGGGNAVRH